MFTSIIDIMAECITCVSVQNQLNFVKKKEKKWFGRRLFFAGQDSHAVAESRA